MNCYGKAGNMSQRILKKYETPMLFWLADETRRLALSCVVMLRFYIHTVLNKTYYTYLKKQIISSDKSLRGADYWLISFTQPIH